MALGADVGGSRIKFARLQDGELTLQHQVERERDWPDQLQRELVALADPVGVGVAGLVDHERGVLRWAPHLSGRDVHLGEKLSATLARPVLVDNDANCATRAEADHLDSDPVLVLMIGTGIGMGLWTAGEIYRGAAHAGEAGHMFIENDGLGCRCGRRGCWETRVSGWRFAEVGATEAALEEMGMWLGRGLLTLATLFDPALIVLGGGFIEEHGNTLGDLASAEITRLSDAERPSPPIVRAVHGMWVGAIGAAMLASP
ncbi:ROK family protein [soil metagenome]